MDIARQSDFGVGPDVPGSFPLDEIRQEHEARNERRDDPTGIRLNSRLQRRARKGCRAREPRQFHRQKNVRQNQHREPARPPDRQNVGNGNAPTEEHLCNQPRHWVGPQPRDIGQQSDRQEHEKHAGEKRGVRHRRHRAPEFKPFRLPAPDAHGIRV